jgi:hypothetical protein
MIPAWLRILCWLATTIWIAKLFNDFGRWWTSKDPRAGAAVSAKLFLAYFSASALWLDGMVEKDRALLYGGLYLACAVVCMHDVVSTYLARARQRRAALALADPNGSAAIEPDRPRPRPGQGSEP